MKTKFAIGLTAFFSPVVIMFALVGLAILSDTLAGRWCARHKARAEGKDERLEVTSRKTREGALQKIIAYNLAMLTLYLVDYWAVNEIVKFYLPWDFLLTKIGTIFLVWIEFDSIDEKFYKVKGVRITTRMREFLSVFRKLIGVFINTKNKMKE